MDSPSDRESVSVYYTSIRRNSNWKWMLKPSKKKQVQLGYDQETCEMLTSTSCLHKQFIVDAVHKNFLLRKWMHVHHQTDWTMLEALPYFEGSSLILVPNIMIVVSIERFKERAEIAGWTVEHQLYQLKIHLDQTASDVWWYWQVRKTLLTKLLPLWESVSSPRISKSCMVPNSTILYKQTRASSSLE